MDSDESDRVVVPPQGRVSAETEAERWKLADQVVAVLKLGGLPARVMRDGSPLTFAGAELVVDPTLTGGVFVNWVVSPVLFEASQDASDRGGSQDPVYRWYGELIAELMPATLVRVLGTAGIRVLDDDGTIQVEGPVPGHLLALLDKLDN